MKAGLPIELLVEKLLNISRAAADRVMPFAEAQFQELNHPFRQPHPTTVLAASRFEGRPRLLAANRIRFSTAQSRQKSLNGFYACFRSPQPPAEAAYDHATPDRH
jgi:hypothetical protein